MTFLEVQGLFWRVCHQIMETHGQESIENLPVGYLSDSPIEPNRFNFHWVNISPNRILGSDDQKVIAFVYDPARSELVKIFQDATEDEVLKLAFRYYNR